MSRELGETKLSCKIRYLAGGDAGIRTLDTALRPYNGLANRRLQPLGHVSCGASGAILPRRFAVLPAFRRRWQGDYYPNGKAGDFVKGAGFAHARSGAQNACKGDGNAPLTWPPNVKRTPIGHWRVVGAVGLGLPRLEAIRCLCLIFCVKRDVTCSPSGRT